MEYMVKGADIHLYQPDFDLDETLDCGQAFRWERDGEGYCGFKLNKPLRIYSEKDYFVLKDTTEDDFLEIWADYFDLDTDYGEIKRIFTEDETLSKAHSYAGGIRILRQDSFEALFSFIISQNNNIPRIKGIIGRLCEMYGGFPTAEQIKGTTAEDFAPLRSGFRAKYLADCAEKVNNGIIKLDEIKSMPVEDARRELMKIKGVGPKVADCTMLFGMYKLECVPMDVWMKRVMEKFYPDGFPDYVKPYAGIAQQYLFHYGRTGDLL